MHHQTTIAGFATDYIHLAILSLADVEKRCPKRDTNSHYYFTHILGQNNNKLSLCNWTMIVSRFVLPLMAAFFGHHFVQGIHHGMILLETNALGYNKHDSNVAYSDNYAIVHEQKGFCVNGPPPNPEMAPDAQTTENDATCQALGPCHIGFTQAGEFALMGAQFAPQTARKA
jgi:hypothetical protein